MVMMITDNNNSSLSDCRNRQILLSKGCVRISDINGLDSNFGLPGSTGLIIVHETSFLSELRTGKSFF